ncbi:helix-turn-helix transcriptional regulator [Flavobacterium sp. TSSA_36]|uniref:helix-turn-helix transcriptional regulator n=1 Tax=Flavobacterium sp. TSSA_36 TaxID=3447669 RepID=UPI003F3B335B
MVNTDKFIQRLEILLDYYNLNAATFADKIGVQRSSLSHLLSGRNKPSLDFVLKIIEKFPEIDLYWILLGKGNFPKQEDRYDDLSENSNILPTLPSLTKENSSTFLEETKNNTSVTPSSSEESKEQLDQIIMIYKDGSFKILHPKET